MFWLGFLAGLFQGAVLFLMECAYAPQPIQAYYPGPAW